MIQAGVLEEEVAEIEERLKSMLSLLDDKVKNLGYFNEKWGEISNKMEEMRSWMKGAQKALQQLTSADLTPEEKLKRSKGSQQCVFNSFSCLI